MQYLNLPDFNYSGYLLGGVSEYDYETYDVPSWAPKLSADQAEYTSMALKIDLVFKPSPIKVDCIAPLADEDESCGDEDLEASLYPELDDPVEIQSDKESGLEEDVVDPLPEAECFKFFPTEHIGTYSIMGPVSNSLKVSSQAAIAKVVEDAPEVLQMSQEQLDEYYDREGNFYYVAYFMYADDALDLAPMLEGTQYIKKIDPNAAESEAEAEQMQKTLDDLDDFDNKTVISSEVASLLGDTDSPFEHYISSHRFITSADIGDVVCAKFAKNEDGQVGDNIGAGIKVEIDADSGNINELYKLIPYFSNLTRGQLEISPPIARDNLIEPGVYVPGDRVVPVVELVVDGDGDDDLDLLLPDGSEQGGDSDDGYEYDGVIAPSEEIPVSEGV